MRNKLLETTYLYGKIPNKKTKFSDLDLYSDPFSQPSVFLRKIKVWYGKPKEDCPPCLVGIKCWYINYITSEKKESPYHGAELTSGDIETKELEIKGNDNDYFNKIYIGFDEYITHIKIMTKKMRVLELGEEVDDFEKILKINMSDNMLLFFSGYFSPKGVRSIRINYISRKNYVYYRIIEFLRLRHILKNDEKIEKFYKDKTNYNKLDISMKYVFRTSLLPTGIFSSILKYL